MKTVFVCLQIVALVCVLVLACAVHAQTYKVGGDSTAPKPENKPSDQKPSTNKSLGWGSNIQNARLARAAEQALKNRNFSAALDYAQRAAQAAPNDPQLWFLLGYAENFSLLWTPTVEESASIHHRLMAHPDLPRLTATWGARMRPFDC
jgi:cytochrome c-type biogenesis protein CcmH/NrfG